MTTFDKREKAFETKFIHEEQVDFVVEARCCKLFGLWVAQQIGLNGTEEAQTYALSVVEANLEEPGFDDVLRKVRADYDAKSLAFDETLVTHELAKALEEAKSQIAAES